MKPDSTKSLAFSFYAMDYSNIEQYILDHIDREPKFLEIVNRNTHLKVLYSRMLSGHLQGSILSMLCKMIKPERILELGTFTGYSALCFAHAMDQFGAIDTIEINDELEDFIRENFISAGLDEKINLLIGDALKIIPTLEYTYDLVFIDANKRLYVEYMKAVLPKMKPGGFVIADNVLWYGKVVEAPDPKDEQLQGILSFNTWVKENPRLENCILPIRDGLSIIRVV